jgi:hypothetical protein|tara:strand:+ start:1143 stop:1517 length:375 start_codon:yes stop_codon:yes gene_type:complete
MITEGTVAFSNLEDTERYNGQDTGKYSIVLTLEPDEAAKLAEEGVKLREYKNQPQRKFVTKFSGFPVLDSEGEQIAKYIPYGSRVRVMWEPGKPHPQHGVSPYFKKIKVLEMAEGMAGADDEDF